MNKFVAFAVSSFFLVSSAAFAETSTHGSTHEFDGMCATGLVMGKEVKTDCKINWSDSKTGKTYCFSSEEMKKTWASDTAGHTKTAQENFAKMHAGAHGTTGSSHNM
jgi:YHS domain-containing protein